MRNLKKPTYVSKRDVLELTILRYLKKYYLPYACHYNPLLIRNRSLILTIHKARILRKKPTEKTFFDFKKWVKSIQTAGYNGARAVIQLNWFTLWYDFGRI